MEYVIRHCESGKYLSLVKLRNEAVWVDLDKAHRFSDRQKVDNFMRMNFNNIVRKISCGRLYRRCIIKWHLKRSLLCFGREEKAALERGRLLWSTFVLSAELS